MNIKSNWIDVTDRFKADLAVIKERQEAAGYPKQMNREQWKHVTAGTCLAPGFKGQRKKALSA